MSQIQTKSAKTVPGTVYDQTKIGIARVMIHDLRRTWRRYCIQRVMRLPNGKTKVTYGYRHQLPAAKRHADDWLEARASLFAKRTLTNIK